MLTYRLSTAVLVDQLLPLLEASYFYSDYITTVRCCSDFFLQSGYFTT